MSDLNTEISITANADGVEAGVGRAKRSLADLGATAKRSGQDAADGVGKIGLGGDAAARKVDAATRSMQNSIQRLVAEQKAGEKGSRAYWEALADTRGVSAASLKPYLDQLDQIKAKTSAAKAANEDWMGSLRSINGLLAGLGAAVSVAGISTFVKQSIDAADSMSKLSQKSGVAVESLLELNYAASLSDVSTEGLATGLRKLSQNMAEAAKGSKEQSAAFAAVGVNVQNLDGSLKGADEVLKELATRFANFKDGPEKAALAIELFGKQGAELIPLLNGGAAGLSEMAEEARSLGIVFGADLAKNAETFNDNLTRIQASSQGAATAIAGQLLPTLNLLTQEFIAAKDGSQSFATSLGGGLRTVVESATILYANVSFVLQGIGREIGAIGAQFAAIGRGDFSGWTAISDAVKEDGKRARAELDKFTFDLLNAGILTSKAGAGRGTAPDPRSLGDTSDSAPIVRVAEKAAKAAKEAQSEYDKLMQKLGVDLPKAAAEAEAAQMGYNKAQAEFIALAGSDAWAKFSNTQRATVAALYETKIASEQAGDAAKKLAKAEVDAVQAREKYLTSLAAGIDKIKADIAAQEEATARMGLSKEAIADLDAAKLEMLATDLELQAIKAMDRNLDQQTYDALKKQAAAYRELGIAKKGGAAKEAALDMEKANADAAKKAQEDWERASEQINSTLTDALMRGFESGKDFAKNLRDTVVNMFKTLVLRPIISAVVNPVAGAVTNALGLGGGQSGGGGIAGGIQTASNLNSLYGAGSQALFGGTAGASAASLGYANVVGMAGGDAIGALATANGMWAGVATGAQGAAQAAIAANVALEAGTATALASGTTAAAAGGTAAAGAGGISGALAAIPGWGWAALAGVAVLGSIFGKDDSGTYHTGGAGSYSAAGGANTGAKVLDQGLTFGVRYKDYNSQAESAAVGISQSIVGMLDATAKSFGNQAGYFAATAFADDSSKDGAWGSLIIKRLDDTVTNWADTQTSKWAPKVFSDGEAGQKEYAAALAMSVRDALVGAVEGVDWAQSLLTGLGDAPTLEGLQGVVATINAAQAAFDALGKNIVGFGALTDGAISQLIKAAGSIDGLVSAASTYYENFYTDAEKTANVTRDVAAALADVGLQMPTTRDEFRALVEAQMALGDSGTGAVAALLGVSGAFASVTAASETAADAAARLADEQGKAAARAAEEAARRAEEIARERYGLETQIMQLLGDTAGLRMREIEALDASNRALQEHIYAIEDAREAYQKSITAANDAYSGLERSVAAEKTALQAQYELKKKGFSDTLKVQADANSAQIEAARAAADKIRGIASALQNALKSSRVDSPSINAARLSSARSTISGAAESNNLFAPGLESALAVAGADNKQFYGRFEDYAYAQGVTAGEIAKLNTSAQAQLSAAESIVNSLSAQNSVAQLISDAEMAALDEWYAQELKKLDDTLTLGKSQLDAMLGIDKSVLSVADAVASLANAINASNAALQAQRAAEAAAQMAAMQGGGGGGGAGGMGGGTSYKGATYTDFMGNQVALQAGQSRQFLDAVAAAGTSAVSSLSELRDRLQAVGKSDIWEALSKDLTLSYQDVDKTGGRGVPGISASDGVILVAGYRSDNESMQDYATKISGWARNNGVQGPTNNGYSQSDISNAISTTLGQGTSVADILNAGAVNFGLTEQEIREAARAAGIPGFASGGYHTGGLRLVGENGPELESTGPAKIWNAADTQRMMRGGADNSGMTAALQAMAARLDAIEANTRATAGHAAGTDRKLARVIQNDAIKTETTV